MFHYINFVIILNLSIGYAFENAFQECNANETFTNLLDAATNLITKAILKFPQCPSLMFKPADCEEILQGGQNKTGIYTIWPRTRAYEERSLRVSCDMDTDGGGWTVIQRRGNFGRSKDYFFKGWTHYKNGFGKIEEDFWLGNDNIFSLTSQRLYSIRFDLKAVDGDSKYAQYDTFWIDDEEHMYRLHIKDYKGNAGDSMTIQHDNAKFSTHDKDNDNDKRNCAMEYTGAWWYNSCHHSNLNGFYLKGHHESFADGINWSSWKHFNESLEFTEMKIRPTNFRKSDLSSNIP